MKNDTIESVVAFIFGGVPAMIVSFQMFGDVVWPMVLASLTGLVGGGFALLGKDLYKWVKSKMVK